MRKSFGTSARIGLGFALIWAIGCGGSSTHPNNDAKDGPKETASGGSDGGTAGVTGTAGRDGGTDATGGAAAGAGGAGGAAGAGDAAAGAGGADAGAGGAAADDAGAAGAGGSDAGAGGAAGNPDAATDTAPDSATDGGVDASDAGDAGDAGDAADAACPVVCTVNATRCGAGGGVQTCTLDSNSCPSWAAEVACGPHSVCAASGGGAACGCNAAVACGAVGDFCASGTTKATCAVDGDGCKYVAGPAVACPTRQSCTGSAGSAVCSCDTDAHCSNDGATFCASAASKSTCAVDGNGCFYVSATGSCPTHESCKGSYPSGACSCDAAPAECLNAAGTFCATSTSVSTCAVDSATTCVFVQGTAACGPHQTCTGANGSAACACNPVPAACNAEGFFCDSNGNSGECKKDAQGCFYVASTTTCGARQTCTGGTCHCNTPPSGCTAAGTFCDSNGALATCAADGNGCFFISGTPAACGTNQTCTGALPGAACTCNAAPAGCTAGGPFCDATGKLATCTVDGQGCRTITAVTACGQRQTCTGAIGSASCQCNPGPAGCTGGGTYCPSTGSQSTCAADAQGCFYESATASCPSNQTCKGSSIGSTCTCDNTCTAGQVGTYCTDTTHVSSCANDTNGCHLTSNNQACLGTRTCRGADGAGACLCPAIGFTAGTGCGTLGTTVCQGNTVLTCTVDSAGGCNIWTPSLDCTGGSLVCGAKSGIAACQCPEHSGVSYYVDSSAGTDGATGVFATGIDSPAECRFNKLGTALAKTVAGDRVVATKSGAPSMTFAAESFPLTVPAGVTLTTADSLPTVGNYIIQINGGATSGIALGSSSVFEGFSVQNTNGNAATSAVSVAGTGVVIDTVDLEGTGSTKLATGIDVNGGGNALINGVTVAGFVTGVGVSTTSGTAVSLLSSTLTANTTGLSLANGTVSVTTVAVTGATGSGVVIKAAVGALSTLNGSGLTVSGATGTGLSQSATGGTATLNLTSGDVHNNGGGGISLSAGTGTLGTVLVHDNTTSGISQSGGALTIGASTIQTNTGTGISLSGGTLTVGAASVTGNTTDGLSATAGTITVNTGAKFDSNGGDGLRTATSVTVNGSSGSPISMSNNTGNGISVTGGTLTASYLKVDKNGTGTTKNAGLKVSANGVVNLGSLTDANLVLSNNGLAGVSLTGTTAASAVSLARTTITGNGVGAVNGGGVITANVVGSAASTSLGVSASTITGNTGSGILVDLNSATGAITNTTVGGNTGNGILVDRAPLISGTVKLTLDNLIVNTNGANGIYLRGNSGSIGALLKSSKLSGNTGAGLRVEQTAANTTQETIQNNDITGNGGGGIAFSTSSTLNGFSGNTIHGNAGDQLLIAARQNPIATNPAWNLASGSSCAANQNQVYCYSSTGVGIRVTSVVPTSVNATFMSWASAVPAATIDYVTGTSTLTASNACAAVLTCP